MTREMRDPTFVILASLANGERHGYAIIAEAEALSGGAVHLFPGTLYAALDRLGSEGLIEVVREQAIQGRLRRYYQLTDTGLRELTIEAERRCALANRALARLSKPTALAFA